MTNVKTLSPGGIVTREEQRALEEMDRAVAHAIDAAKTAGVPVGLVVAVLAGHFHSQTQRMIIDG